MGIIFILQLYICDYGISYCEGSNLNKFRADLIVTPSVPDCVWQQNEEHFEDQYRPALDVLVTHHSETEQSHMMLMSAALVLAMDNTQTEEKFLPLFLSLCQQQSQIWDSLKCVGNMQAECQFTL